MIAINCRFLTQDLTGVQRFAEEITAELARTREDVRLFAPPGALRHTGLGGREVEQIGTASGHRWEQWDLPRMLRREHGSPLLLSLMNTGPVLYRNQVVTHHDVTYVRFPQTYTKRFRVAYRMLSSLTLHRARQVITVSEFSRREIVDVYGIDLEKIRVVPNAAGSEFRRPHQESDPAYFLAVASFLPHKNIDRMVDAFERYRAESGSTTTLRLVGSARPASMARSDGSPRAASGVELLGRVDDRRLQELYAGARGFIFPSLYEGFGVPPLEAQSAGAPVAAADIPPVREALGDSALFFDPSDTKSMSDAFLTLDADADARQRLRAAGHSNVGRRSWERSAGVISLHLDEMIRSDRHLRS
ncbi:glycosyltransferase family 4 protein [Microbacterium sp. 22195]|uniref:glycosyltransferase family 4 protein n=1 Tax=Microbacterium sp. 22195 TaxID=3453891 RepID=UPI003F82636C